MLIFFPLLDYIPHHLKHIMSSSLVEKYGGKLKLSNFKIGDPKLQNGKNREQKL